MKKLLAIFCFTALFSFPILSQNLNTKKLDSYFDTLEANNQAMGTFSVSKNGKIMYTRSIGYRTINATEQIKASNETLYRIGSTTKTFTATMIFQLIDEDKLSLTTTLAEYYPKIPNADKITIELLLRHRSGLYDFVNGHADREWIKRPQTREVIIDDIINGTPNFKPDKEFAYCNTGYYLLACIIEKITGETYNENLQKRICSKLQLNHTYSPPDNVPQQNEATGYLFEDGKWVAVPDDYFPNIVGVGDILSTTTDLIVFMDALLDAKLTSVQSLNLMKPISNRNHGFGRGTMIIPYNVKSGIGHRGDTFGTHTAVARTADDSLTFASCINGKVIEPKEINNGLLRICYDAN